MFSRPLQDKSLSRLPDVLETGKMFIEKESTSVSNNSKSVSDKSLFDKAKANPRQIQDALIKTK